MLPRLPTHRPCLHHGSPQVTASHISKIGELVQETIESLDADDEATAQLKKHYENTVAHVKALKAQGGRFAELNL